MRSGPISPWFAGFWSDALKPGYLRAKFLHREVLTYLALLLWPVVLTTFPVSLLPLPGALINLIDSGYLIQSAQD
jgi:hypothetical protein